MIIATDGVWDVTLGQDILGIIKMRGKLIKTLQNYLKDRSNDFDPDTNTAHVLDQIAQDIVTFLRT